MFLKGCVNGVKSCSSFDITVTMSWGQKIKLAQKFKFVEEAQRTGNDDNVFAMKKISFTDAVEIQKLRESSRHCKIQTPIKIVGYKTVLNTLISNCSPEKENYLIQPTSVSPHSQKFSNSDNMVSITFDKDPPSKKDKYGDNIDVVLYNDRFDVVGRIVV